MKRPVLLAGVILLVIALVLVGVWLNQPADGPIIGGPNMALD